MTPEQFARLGEIFDAALGVPADERTCYVRSRCDNEEMVQKIEAMLAHDATAAQLETPALGRSFHVGDTQEHDRRLSEEIATEGRFRVLSTVGEGGFGTVFRAEQLRPVRRIVALKIVKLGMDSKRVLARFESERATLTERYSESERLLRGAFDGRRRATGADRRRRGGRVGRASAADTSPRRTGRPAR